MSRATTGLVARTRRVPMPEDPLALLGPGGFAWIHADGGLVTSGTAARVPAAEAADRLATVDCDDDVRRPGTGPVAAGALPFDDPGRAELVVPCRVWGWERGGAAWCTVLGPDDEPPAPAPPPRPGPARFVVTAGQGLDAWRRNVRRALEAIDRGEIEKVVLAREVEVEADTDLDVRVLAARLLATQPGCWVYASGGVVGASPELLVSRRGGEVVSRPLAGTVPRGTTREDDDRRVDALRASMKDAYEHRLVADEVARVLREVCTDVTVDAQPRVMRFADVAHLATTVRGRAGDHAPDALTLALALHPTPAVGGTPREPALALIGELEPFARGPYAGPVGWVDARGDGDVAVALRGAQVEGRRARLVAGAGIVAGSDPDDEWVETQAKLEPVLRALVRP